MDKMALLSEIQAMRKAMNAALDRMAEKITALESAPPPPTPQPQEEGIPQTALGSGKEGCVILRERRVGRRGFLRRRRAFEVVRMPVGLEVKKNRLFAGVKEENTVDKRSCAW